MSQIIKPKIRSGVCFTVKPEGLQRMVERQVARAREAAPLPQAPRSVLVLGASGGYGLAARIVAAFAGGADTFGVSFERPPNEAAQGTPGWYNNEAFDRICRAEGRRAVTMVADAFLPETRAAVVAQARAAGFAPLTPSSTAWRRRNVKIRPLSRSGALPSGLSVKPFAARRSTSQLGMWWRW